MNENPFKIIRSTDQSPASLRKEVMSTVKFAMLILRFVQLFVADFSLAVFDKVRRTHVDRRHTDEHKPSSPHGS